MANVYSSASQRVLAIPELLQNIFFSLEKRGDTYHAALVCRTWSEIALDVLWYEVDDICALFNLLVPLKDSTSTTDEDLLREFVRCPEPHDWTKFEKYSHRVKKLVVCDSTAFPAQTFFDDIARSRIRHEILPNLWCLHWLSSPCQSVIFLHSGIRELCIWMDVNIPAKMKFFMRNARFFSQNIHTLQLRTCHSDNSDPHPVGRIEAELSGWLAQLHSLRRLVLPRFWLTTESFKVLYRHDHLASLEFAYEHRAYGSPLDTLAFKPVSDGETLPKTVFPSLLDLSQNAPFSRMVPFISSWQGSSHLTDLTIASQIMESPDSFHSILNVIADHCTSLTGLGLTCLISPYWHHQRNSTPSGPRITLDTLLPLHKLKRLTVLEIAHTLPLALSDDDFLVLIRKWPGFSQLRLGHDPYPFNIDAVYAAESHLSLSADSTVTTNYPIIGLRKSMESLRKHCPRLEQLCIHGIDDFDVGDGHHATTAAEDDPAPSPFPNLTRLAFGTSLITSDKHLVALTLSQYVSPNIQFRLGSAWGGDENNPYLIYLNLKPLVPLRDELNPVFQTLIDIADPDPPDGVSGYVITDFGEDQPVGVDGLVDEDTAAKLEERSKPAEEIARLIQFMARARLDEREKVKRQLGIAS